MAEIRLPQLGRAIECRDGENLYEVLARENLIEGPCGGRGVCGKCRVVLDGRETLSCECAARGACEVLLPEFAGVGDIVSDGVPLGAVQIPSHGMPIVMLADRQTTGGYTKIGVLTPLSIEALVQKMPGSPVRFRKASIDDGTAEQMKIAEAVRRVGELRSTYVSRPRAAQANGGFASARLRLTVNGKQYEVTCEEIK